VLSFGYEKCTSDSIAVSNYLVRTVSDGGNDYQTDIFGDKLSEIHYLNDEQHGPCKYFHSTGTLFSLVNYEDGKAVGPFISYFENGAIASNGKRGHLERIS
jgi:antitoxin component YwqK of YwqJK toxin-antitoxin module